MIDDIKQRCTQFYINMYMYYNITEQVAVEIYDVHVPTCVINTMIKFTPCYNL